MTSSARLAPLAALAVALAAPAVAQDDDRLPSLTPRVFETQGTIAINLPDIERQPLTGFGPPPRTYVVPAERAPVTRPFAPDLDGLPALALAPPPEPPSDLAEPQRVRAEGGGGSQTSRYGRFDLSATGAAGLFVVDADYDGIAGRDLRVGTDALDVRAAGQSFGPGRVRLGGHLALDQYRAPGDVDDARRRRAIGAEAGVGGVGAIPFDAALRFEHSAYRHIDGEESTEGRLDLDGRLAVFDDRIRFDGALGTAGSGGFGTDAQYGAIGAAVALERADGLRLVVGARGLAFDAASTVGGGSGRRVGPILDLEVPLGPALRVFVTNDPHLVVRSLADLTRLNPFLSSRAASPVVVPDMVQVDGRGGVEIRRGALRLRGYATALRAPTYLVFGRVGDAYAESYVRATGYGLGGDLALATASGLTASAGFEARTAEADGAGDLPYYAPFVGRAGVQTPFAAGRGHVGLAVYGEAARPTDGADDAPAFARVSLDASFAVSGPFSAVLRGERLLGEVERWPGYPHVPYAVLVGLRFAR